MANDQTPQVADNEWDYKPAKKQEDDEWDYKPAQSAPNLRTGEGMQDAATKQAAKQVRQPIDRLREKESAFSMFTPTGITRDVGDPELERVRHAANVSGDVVGAMSMIPGAAGTLAERGLIGGAKVLGKGIGRAALGGAAGGAVGGYAGREIGGAVGHPEAGKEIGAGIGGLAGGFLGTAHPEMLPSEGRFGKLFNRLRPEVEEFPGASLPSTEEFYAKRGAEINSMRKLQPGAFRQEPWDVPTQGGSVGAQLPDAGEFYDRRGTDLMARGRQQGMLDRATTRAAKEAAANEESVGAKIFPEPRDPLPGDRPGAMWSIGREEVLPEAAQRGAPGAGDVLRNIGKPIIYTPREGVGYSPRGEFEAAQGRMQTPLPPEAEPAGLKRGLMTERRSSVRDVQGPDLMRTARAQQLREQLLDSSLSARDREIIQEQLDDLKANPFERHEGGDINSMKAKKTLSREEAEANTAKRKEGRNKRFGGAS